MRGLYYISPYRTDTGVVPFLALSCLKYLQTYITSPVGENVWSITGLVELRLMKIQDKGL